MRGSTILKKDDLFFRKDEGEVRETINSVTTFGDFDGDLSKKSVKSWLYIVLTMMGIVFSIATFWTSIVSYRASLDHTVQITHLTDNWKKIPITNIVALDDEDNYCPEKYEALFSGHWPGTHDGCDCHGATEEHINGTIVVDKCDSLLDSFGCKTVEAKDPLKLQHLFGKQICVFREGTPISEVHRPVLDAEGNWLCEEGFK